MAPPPGVLVNPPPTAFRLAATHPLNLVMLLTLGISAAATGSVIPLGIAAVAEAGWLLFGPRQESLRRYAAFLRQQHAQRADVADEQAWLRRTTEADRRRFLELDQVRRDIRRLVEGHGNLSLEMMAGELHKVDRLLQSFLRVAVATSGLEKALADSDPDALAEQQADLQARGTDPQGLALVEQRLVQVRTLRQKVADHRRQLDRVAAQLRLVRDQVASMQRPEEMAAHLDDLVRTVEVIEATSAETEGLERPVAARRAAAQTQSTTDS